MEPMNEMIRVLIDRIYDIAYAPEERRAIAWARYVGVKEAMDALMSPGCRNIFLSTARGILRERKEFIARNNDRRI